jgi:hypothetical protein
VIPGSIQPRSATCLFLNLGGVFDSGHTYALIFHSRGEREDGERREPEGGTQQRDSYCVRALSLMLTTHGTAVGREPILDDTTAH